VVETGREREMELFNHNGLDVASEEEVRAAHEQLSAVKEQDGIRRIQKPRAEHGVPVLKTGETHDIGTHPA
jgi:hypothetical protein